MCEVCHTGEFEDTNETAIRIPGVTEDDPDVFTIG